MAKFAPRVALMHYERSTSKKKKKQFCITSYVINTKTAEHSAKNCTRHSFSRVCKSLGLILRLRLSYLHHLAEDASSTKSYRKLEKEQ